MATCWAFAICAMQVIEINALDVIKSLA